MKKKKLSYMYHNDYQETFLEDTSRFDSLIRLVFFFTALFTTLSLISYSSLDPSLITWSSNTNIHNWMGRLGSIVADLCIELVGWAGSVLLVSLCYVLSFFSLRSMSSWLIALLFGVLSVLESGRHVGLLLFPSTKNLTGFFGQKIVECFIFIAGHWGAFLLSCFWCSAVLVGIKKDLFRSACKLLLILARKFFSVQKKQALETSLPVDRPTQGHTYNLLPMDGDLASKDTGDISDPSPERVESANIIKKNMGRFMFGPQPKNNRSSVVVKNFEKDSYVLPTTDILTEYKAPSQEVSQDWCHKKKELLTEKLKDFGVEGEVVRIAVGPVITVFEYKPASGVKIKEISQLSDDLTLALSVFSVRIVAPIPGKPVVGIEIPTPTKQLVLLKDIIDKKNVLLGSSFQIPIILGKTTEGEIFLHDLAAMPHLLVAGSTGTGKSVFMNTLIASLLFRFTPDELKLILVDPKMVELASYEGISHLLLPVVVDPKKASRALRWAIEEMERRYALLHEMGVRNIQAYNAKIASQKKVSKNHETSTAPSLAELMVSSEKKGENTGPTGVKENTPLPYIVIVIDEYADLMSIVSKEVEISIARLAQKARASGIHLILATQRPSTDVVTGIIKANFPTRLSFRVASNIDSKTILDRSGAERLLGGGDMLFHAPGLSSLLRLQGAYLSDKDIENLVEYIKNQRKPLFDEKLVQAIDTKGDGEGGERISYEGDREGDKESLLLEDAIMLIREKKHASISLLQRHLRIGYNKAANLMEILEKRGFVEPLDAFAPSSSKRRAVKLDDTDFVSSVDK